MSHDAFFFFFLNLEIYVQQVNSTTKTHGRDMSCQSTKKCHDGGSWFGIARGERVWVFAGGVVG